VPKVELKPLARILTTPAALFVAPSLFDRSADLLLAEAVNPTVDSFYNAPQFLDRGIR
jgi:hypothetical protein